MPKTRRATIIALMMEALSTSETSVNFYEATRRNIPEDSHLQIKRSPQRFISDTPHHEKQKRGSRYQWQTIATEELVISEKLLELRHIHPDRCFYSEYNYHEHDPSWEP
jgi:hypothetical protein